MKPLELIIIFDLKYNVKNGVVCASKKVFTLRKTEVVFSCKTYSNNPYLQL